MLHNYITTFSFTWKLSAEAILRVTGRTTHVKCSQKRACYNITCSSLIA